MSMCVNNTPLEDHTAELGLITQESGGSWRVEMLCRYDVRHSNLDRAVGFAHGIAAAS